MRAVLFIIIVAVIIVIAAIATGFVSVSKIRGGEIPQVSAGRNGVSAKGGQAPAFDVETGSVKVGTRPTRVNMPTLEVDKAPKQPTGERAGNAM